MFKRGEVKAAEQEQNPQGQSDQGRRGDSSSGGRRFTLSWRRRTETSEGSNPAETPASDKAPGKQRDTSGKAVVKPSEKMTGANLSEEQLAAMKDFNPTEGNPTFWSSKHARRSSVSSFDSSLYDNVAEPSAAPTGDYIPYPTIEPRDGVPLIRPKPPKPPARKDSGYESAEDHGATGFSPASSWGKEMTTKDLTSLTNQELNNKEARLEANVERGTDLRARHKAKQEIGEIHEQKRRNKKEYFKGGLRKTYKELVESMVTVVSEDVQTTKEPKVHAKILKTEEASRVTAEKRDKSQEKCTTHNVYAKLNALSMFRRAQEQSLSAQPEFNAIERAVYRKKLEAVRDGLRDIRKRSDVVDKSHLRAHGIIDIEKGTITLNGSNTVIKLHEIRGITANEPVVVHGKSKLTPQISVGGEDAYALDSTPPSPIHGTSFPFMAESSSSHAPLLKISTAGDSLSPGDALSPRQRSRRLSDASTRSHKRRDSDAVSFHSELSTHGSKEKSWTIQLSVGKEVEQIVDGKTTKTMTAEKKTATVENSSTETLLATQHLINFQTGRIELANGTMIDLKDIDWAKNKAEEPTKLHLKQGSPLYIDGTTLDLKEASKSLDAAAMANRQKYEQALKQYRLTQMAMLEKVAHAGSSSLSDMHALLAGIRTNDSSVVKVQDDIARLKRAEDSVTTYHFKEAVRRIGNEATSGLLHIRQKALNDASKKFARALKSSALADVSKEKGRFGKFGETETVKTIKGTHEGPSKGIELQNDTDLPKYDKQKAREDEFNAQTATLNAQREDLATRLDASNAKVSTLDTKQKDLLTEADGLKKEAADLRKWQREYDKAVAPFKQKHAEFEGENKTLGTRKNAIEKEETDLKKQQTALKSEETRLKDQQTALKSEETRLKDQQTTLKSEAAGSANSANKEGSSATTEAKDTPTRLAEIEARLGKIPGELEPIEARLGKIPDELKPVEARLGKIPDELKSITDRQNEMTGQWEPINADWAKVHREKAAAIDLPARGLGETVSKRQNAINTRLGAIENELKTTVWNHPDWIERAKVQDEHKDSVARCEEQEQKKKDFDALEKRLATSNSPFTRNSYHIRKITEADALGQLDNVKKYVDALQRVDVEPGDNDLVKARKEYENARVDHIVKAHNDAKAENNPNELRMALYEERYHASIVRYNISRAKYALENDVSETVKDSKGNEIRASVSIDRLKSVRMMHLEDIITDSNTLSAGQEAAQHQSQHSYDKTMYRVKPAEFVPKPPEEKTAADNAAEFTVYARERARYEVQKLIDKTEDVNDKAKMIDNRGDLEKDFVERFTKSYGEERARAHEVQRVTLARKAMNDFAWKMFGMALITNFQMAHNSFDQSIDSTLNSIIRSNTRTA